MMSKHNPANERIKRKYLIFQKEARQQSEATIDSIAKSISRFEEYTNWRDFKKFHHEQAVGFKKRLCETANHQTGKPLSKSTVNSTVNNLKRFFEWLSQQSGYKSRIDYSDAEYFNLSEKDVRTAAASRPIPFPTLAQIKHVLAHMPAETPIEQRDRALIAFTLLTGARDSAIASLSLKHVNLTDESLFQDARDVATKFSKTFVTFFFPVGREVTEIFSAWVLFLTEEQKWGNDDPLFPSTRVGLNSEGQFQNKGLKREHWKTASPIREIFKRSFEEAGLPYFNPHSFRKTLVQLAEQECKSPEEFKAWSQNLGHEKVMTTLMSYGQVSIERQKELLETHDKSDVPHVDLLAKLRRLVDEERIQYSKTNNSP